MIELDWGRAFRLGAAIAAMALLQPPAYAVTIARASDWLGSIVVTHDGDEVGTIRDFGIDQASGHVEYIVVSVGSFLIENNLIAVRPDALVQDSDHRFVLEADLDQLKQAKRFAFDSTWPARADVARSTKLASAPRSEHPAEATTPAAANGGTEAASAGTATITSKTKQAYLSADQRYVKEVEKPAGAKSPGTSSTLPPIIESKPQPATDSASQAARSSADGRFDQLDRDHDGVLNRAEIATEMGPKDKYSKLDVNADGVIERDEFEAFESQRASP